MQRIHGHDQQQEVVGRDDEEFHARHVVVSAAILLTAALAALPWVRVRFGNAGFAFAYSIATAIWLVLCSAGSQPAVCAGARTRARRRVAATTAAESAALQRPVPFRFVILVLLATHAPLLLQPALLSSDIHRYRWDGRVSLAGVNPYRYAPGDAALSHLRDPDYVNIEHREVRSVYPPGAQLLFTVWAATGAHLITWRLMLLVAEFAIVLILWRRDPRVALAFATCPLVIVESFWSGHIDLVAGAFLMAAVTMTSAGFLAIATLVKIIPAAALPVLARGRARTFVSVFAAIVGLPVLGYAVAGGVMTGLGDYATRWSFNSPIFVAVRSLIEVVNLDAALKNLWSLIKNPLHLEAVSPTVYAQLYPDFLARVFLLAFFVAAFILILRFKTAAVDSVGLLILFSPTIHPWYWLTVVPLALLSRRWIWLVLAIASPLSYPLYEGVPQTAIWLACYAPAVVFALLQTSSALRERDIKRWTAFLGDSPS